MLIPLNQITVNARQREEYGDVANLAESFKKLGQLNAITVDNNYNLIAGGRRLAAAALLGWTEIKAEIYGQVDELRAQEIELEENIARKQLTWAEEQKAIAKIHEIKSKQEKDWSAEKTAELIGKSRRTVFNALELSKAIDKDPEIAAAETAQGAMLRLTRAKQLQKRQEEVKVAQMAQSMGMVKKTHSNVTTYHGDAVEYLAKLEDSSIDCIVTNPPFGVEIEKVFKGNRKIYDDKPEEIYPMLAQAYKEIYRALKTDRWFLTFWPTATIELCKRFLTDAGFEFDSVPWIWYKPDKYVTAMGDPYSDVNIQYETFFLAKKGRPKWVNCPNSNVVVQEIAGKDRLHPLQMPPEFWQTVLPYIAQPGEKIVEPFSGSGSCAIAALRLNMHYEGYELDQDFYERSQMWISEEKLGVNGNGKAKDEPKAEPVDVVAKLNALLQGQGINVSGN